MTFTTPTGGIWVSWDKGRSWMEQGSTPGNVEWQGVATTTAGGQLVAVQFADSREKHDGFIYISPSGELQPVRKREKNAVTVANTTSLGQ